LLDYGDGYGTIGTVLGVFTDIGTYPPKPPPLVELQRNPQGLRFFLQFFCKHVAATQQNNKELNWMLQLPLLEAMYIPHQGLYRRQQSASCKCLANMSSGCWQSDSVCRCACRQVAAGALVYSSAAAFRSSFRISCVGTVVVCRAKIQTHCLRTVRAGFAFYPIVRLLTAVKAVAEAAVIDLASLRS